MKKTRYTEEQIIGAIKQHEAGAKVEDICRKRQKKLHRTRQPMELPTGVNERWSMDFVSDQLANGRRFRVLNVVDDFSREVVGQLVSVSISGHQAARFLTQLCEERGASKEHLLQRDRVHQQGDVFLEQGNRGGTGLYPARQTDSERVCEEPEWQVP